MDFVLDSEGIGVDSDFSLFDRSDNDVVTNFIDVISEVFNFSLIIDDESEEFLSAIRFELSPTPNGIRFSEGGGVVSPRWLWHLEGVGVTVFDGVISTVSSFDVPDFVSWGLFEWFNDVVEVVVKIGNASSEGILVGEDSGVIEITIDTLEGFWIGRT